MTETAFKMAASLVEVVILTNGLMMLALMVMTRSPYFPVGMSNYVSAAWGFHIAAVVSGVWMLMALLGTAIRFATTAENIYRSNVSIPFTCQILSFGLALMIDQYVVIHVMKARENVGKADNQSKPRRVNS